MAGNLTARKVETAKPGKYSDGGNLYLIVAPAGSRKWVLRFTWRGRAKEMGLGSASNVPLADARERAAHARKLIAKGLNPIDEKKRGDGIPTFGEVAESVRESLSAGFRNEKHKAQWKSTLETYAASLRAKPVDTITTDDVLAALKPIWNTKTETASRVRGRIEKVLDAAKAKGFRDGENPARWRGHLDHLLPKPSKLSRGHHPAMPYEEVATFIANLRQREATAALALELCILTAARSGEVLGMHWSEIDFDKKIWTVPAGRMKAGRVHRVPLSARAVTILRQLEKLKTSEFVLAGQARNQPLSNMAMEMVLRRMKVENATVHGFRSSFRDWAGNVSSFPREVVETALAHVIGDKAEQACHRRQEQCRTATHGSQGDGRGAKFFIEGNAHGNFDASEPSPSTSYIAYCSQATRVDPD
ncbi:tyrosine-type recombinase/integrase [Bradyrhizobium barranii subsp. apii]|uniref:Tyrosine-type recombinase/integrase n=1 Tax=Bradyrhizobium barranii subsp. apii TaxID=2819348 RepID=A0A8T5V2C6_9BRAD|nr:site-specific integrase [Bradyrhizobium barranii]UPT88003.1 tyrosine-type recombinase/integrase [Bradyrhizobium barranii subsp. apii]